MDTFCLSFRIQGPRIVFIVIFLLQKSGEKSVHISLKAEKKYVKKSNNDFGFFSTLLKGYTGALFTLDK